MALKDKASKIDLTNLAGPSAPKVAGAKTAIGMHAEALFRDEKIAHENSALKDQLKTFEGSSPLRKIDHKLIQSSIWANRIEDSYSGPDFELFKEEIESSEGNIQPILVRPIPGSDPEKYEIVFGHRRHRACALLDLPVLAMIESMDDQALFEKMDRENRLREDLRPYEQGLMYAKAMDSKLYPSMRMLAESIGINSTAISKAVRIARLPTPILDSFPSRLDIQYRWSQPLAEFAERYPDLILKRAHEIIEQRRAGSTINAADVLDRLISAPKAGGAGKPEPRHVKVGGQIVATIKESKSGFRIDIVKGALTDEKQAGLERAISEWIE